MQHLHKVTEIRNKRSLKFDFQFQLSLYKRTLHNINMLRIFRSARLVRFISVCGPYFMSSSFFFTHLFTIILKKLVFLFFSTCQLLQEEVTVMQILTSLREKRKSYRYSRQSFHQPQK